MRYLLSEETAGYFRDMGVSGLTDKHYKIRLTKNYTYGLSEIEAVGKDLRLTFDVKPTFARGLESDDKGNLKNTKQYYVKIQFVNAEKYAKCDLSELIDLSKNEIKTKWKSIVDNCDLKFHSNDPSFYWQGFWEDLDSKGAAIFPFKGPKGKGIWRDIHAESGGLYDSKFRVTKHITQILLDLKEYEGEIIQYLQDYDI